MHNVLSVEKKTQKKQPCWQGAGSFPLNLLEERVASCRDKTSMKRCQLPHGSANLTSPPHAWDGDAGCAPPALLPPIFWGARGMLGPAQPGTAVPGALRDSPCSGWWLCSSIWLPLAVFLEAGRGLGQDP